MIELNLPKYPVQIKKESHRVLIQDHVRKKWLELTPEEYVRQHCLFHLNEIYGYALGLFLVEKKLNVYRTSKRTDIVVYKNFNPYILVECKAPYIDIDEETLNQAIRYNISLGARFIWITNGIQHYYFKWEELSNSYSPIKDLPIFKV